MAAEISLRPEDDAGVEILDELEEQTEVKSFMVEDDKTRRYYVSATDADIDAFDPMLEKIDPAWRDHVSNLTPRN